MTKDEFNKFLEEHEFFATNKELDLLFERYDKDKDGKVSYGEFISEISPKEIYWIMTENLKFW